MTTDGAWFSGSGEAAYVDPTLLLKAWGVVIIGITELSDEALRELHGAVVQEHIRRENVKAKAYRRRRV